MALLMFLVTLAPQNGNIGKIKAFNKINTADRYAPANLLL
jgi:hypothetical protein